LVVLWGSSFKTSSVEDLKGDDVHGRESSSVELDAFHVSHLKAGESSIALYAFANQQKIKEHSW